MRPAGSFFPRSVSSPALSRSMATQKKFVEQGHVPERVSSVGARRAVEELEGEHRTFGNGHAGQGVLDERALEVLDPELQYMLRFDEARKTRGTDPTPKPPVQFTNIGDASRTVLVEPSVLARKQSAPVAPPGMLLKNLQGPRSHLYAPSRAHIGASSQTMDGRLENEPNLTKVSSFYTDDHADTSWATSLQANLTSTILPWLNDPTKKAPLAVRHDHKENVGRSMERSRVHGGDSTDVTGSVFVLTKKKGHPGKFDVHTGFTEKR